MAEITTDILVSCADENRRGGIKSVYVINKDDITSFTADTVAGSHAYTAVTLATTDDKWFEVEGEIETKGYSSEGSVENGSVSYEGALELFVPKMEKLKAYGLNEYIQSCKLVVIFETYNKVGTQNSAFVFGYDEIMGTDAAVRVMANEILEATLQGQNGYTATFSGKGAELLREYVGAIETNSSGTINFGA